MTERERERMRQRVRRRERVTERKREKRGTSRVVPATLTAPSSPGTCSTLWTCTTTAATTPSPSSRSSSCTTRSRLRLNQTPKQPLQHRPSHTHTHTHTSSLLLTHTNRPLTPVLVSGKPLLRSVCVQAGRSDLRLLQGHGWEVRRWTAFTRGTFIESTSLVELSSQTRK